MKNKLPVFPRTQPMRAAITAFAQAMLLAGGWALAPASHAQASAGSALIEKNAGIKLVQFVFIPGIVLFRTRLDEAGLLRLGCTYRSEDGKSIEALQQILGRYQTQRKDGKEPVNELRYAVYLGMKDGRQVKILLGQEFSNSRQVSVMLEGKSSAIRKGLAGELVRWADAESLPQLNPQSHGCL